ncbi:hypothetical protein [Burkholderia pseudomallei]|uniref:hypothetical protein n=1 Tax=Burkholderia pseudomallei TaxID=28450 RepID=UPI001E5BE65B|nr:hypothetical protein [Burkholderia pseudomallei]
MSRPYELSDGRYKCRSCGKKFSWTSVWDGRRDRESGGRWGTMRDFVLEHFYGTDRTDLPDFFGPFQSWRTASVASVEQYRCLNSSGVR